MKVRNGFVSNSSSSSFCILSTREDYEKALAQIEDKHGGDAVDVLKNMLGSGNSFTFKGAKGIDLSRVIYSESYWEVAGDLFDDEQKSEEVAEIAYEAMEDLCKIIDELGGYVSEEGC